MAGRRPSHPSRPCSASSAALLAALLLATQLAGGGSLVAAQTRRAHGELRKHASGLHGTPHVHQLPDSGQDETTSLTAQNTPRKAKQELGRQERMRIRLGKCIEIDGELQRDPPRDGVLRGVSGRYGHSATVALLPRSSSEHHASALLVLHDAGPTWQKGYWELLCAWFGGVEGYGTVSIFVSRLHKGAAGWSEPVEVARRPGFSLQNPVWLWDRPQAGTQGTLQLLFTSQSGLDQGSSMVLKASSDDLGNTWSPRLEEVISESGAFIKNTLVSGTTPSQWLMPMYYTPKGANHFPSQYSAVRRSDGDSSVWQEVGQMSLPGSGLVQPSMVRMPNSRLVAFFRQRWANNSSCNYVWRSESEDEGVTWSPATATPLPNPNKAVQAIVLQSGALLMIFNNKNGTATKKINSEGKKKMVDAKHHPVTAGLSFDGGLTWPFVRDLEEYYDPKLEYTYPSVVQTPDGWIHITHTWSQAPCRRCAIRYQRINEQWVKQQWGWGSTRGGYQPEEPQTSWVPMRLLRKWFG